MTCEHWKAWEKNPVMGYCTIRKDVTGVDRACNDRAERPEGCVIYLRSDIARLHEANEGWREKVAQVEKELADYRLLVGSEVARLLKMPTNPEQRAILESVIKNLSAPAPAQEERDG